MTPHQIREQQRLFKTLGANVIAFLAQMDVVMTLESTLDRGMRIARLCSDLELANDSAMRFGLGLQRKGIKLTKISRPSQPSRKED